MSTKTVNPKSISIFLRKVVVYVLFSHLFLGVDLSHINIIATLAILLLTVISFSSIGLISASFVIVFKKENPLLWAFSAVSWFLGGVYYPVTVFPKFLQIISSFILVTYSLRALRLAVLRGHSVGLLSKDITALVIFCIVLVPLAILMFKGAIRRAKKSGSLAFY